MFKKIAIFIFLLFLFFRFIVSVKAGDCNNPGSLDLISINDCLGKTNETLDLISQANQTNKGNLKALQNQVASLKKQLDGLSLGLGQKQTEIQNRNQDFDREYGQLSSRVRSFYIANYNSNILTSIIGSHNVGEALRNVYTFSFLAKRNKEAISALVASLADLQKEKELLSGTIERTAGLKALVDKETAFLAGEVLKAEKYEQQLQGQIAALSARQQEILTSRSGTFTVSIGDSNLADDYNASINGFRESAPSGYFAAFSFGAHTHRKGMSQYGARGRAERGQSTGQILQAYYGKTPVQKDIGGAINVIGYGSLDFETTYLYGIAEMPSSWHTEALKAQAIAARTYAYRYKQNGSAICTDEGCQVFNKGKADNPPDAWKNAVNDTKGQVLEDVVTYYASTHGGYASPIGWDTTNGSGGSGFIDNAYDKIGGSPWLYKAWYTQGYSVNSDKCGRTNPWLTPEEMADIVNAAIALRTGGIDTSRITPVTTSCWGGNPYSLEELRNLVAGNGGISLANSVSVSQGDGNTNNVTINGLSFSGTEFKKAFNLRAPGRLSIPQSGFAFFNIEKK